jgi:hypothetical protein
MPHEPALPRVLRCSPDARSRALDGEAVILHLGTGTYFGSNGAGSLVWELLRAGTTREAILDKLLDVYEVERPKLEEDVDAFLGELVRASLIEVTAGS